MNIKSAFPSKHLKAEDLTKPVTVTITDVKMEKLGDDKKPVLSFKNTDKTLVLNVTNAITISEVLGTDETDHWIGKRITLYATKTDFGGKRVPCIRVSDQAPASGAPAPKPEPKPEPQEFVADDDSVPF